MRFLHFNHRYHPFVGGSEIYIKQVSEWVAARGHEVTVVTSMASDLEYLWDRRRSAVRAPVSETINGVCIQRIPASRFPGQRFLTPAGRRGMGELSRFAGSETVLKHVALNFPRLEKLEATVYGSGAPDAILATNLGLEGMAIRARALARKFDIPYILIPFAHLGSDGDDTARRYVSMPHQVDLLRSADLVLTLTDVEAQFLSGLGVRDASIRAIYCGSTESDVIDGCGAKLRAELGVDGTLVGAIGALAHEKGTPDLIRAVTRLRKCGLAIDLALAGPAMSAFQSWWKDLPAEERQGVHLLGRIDDEEKRDLLDAIDILALPSRTESFGIVFLEAWLNQKPVIAARAGAVPEVVRDEENGLLVDFGDVDGLVSAISRLSEDECLRMRLGNTGRERARTHYTWEEVFGRFQAAYRDVLGIDLGERADVAN